MVKKKKDKLIAVKLSSDELLVLDGLCDAYETDRSKMVRIALRALYEETKGYLECMGEEDNVPYILRTILMMKTNPKNHFEKFKSKEEAEEYERSVIEDIQKRAEATKNLVEGGDTNDDDQ